MHRSLFISIVATCLGGCATTYVAPSAAFQPAPDRITAFQEKSAETNATLNVTRDAGYVGGGCYLGFFVGKVLAARMAPKETASFHVLPGEHHFRVSGDPTGRGLCQGGENSGSTRETLIKVGETKSFRLTTSIGNPPDVQLVD